VDKWFVHPCPLLKSGQMICPPICPLWPPVSTFLKWTNDLSTFDDRLSVLRTWRNRYVLPTVKVLKWKLRRLRAYGLYLWNHVYRKKANGFNRIDRTLQRIFWFLPAPVPLVDFSCGFGRSKDKIRSVPDSGTIIVPAKQMLSQRFSNYRPLSHYRWDCPITAGTVPS
jgi:hypothetical protein